MKLFKTIMMLCALVASFGSIGNAMAAGNELPDMGASSAAQADGGYSAEASLKRDAVCTQ